MRLCILISVYIVSLTVRPELVVSPLSLTAVGILLLFFDMAELAHKLSSGGNHVHIYQKPDLKELDNECSKKQE